MARLRFAAPVVVVLLFVQGAAACYGPDDRIPEEALPCLHALNIGPIASDKGATCVVAYAHLLSHWIMMNLERPPDHALATIGTHHPSVTPLWHHNTFTMDLRAGTILYQDDGTEIVTGMGFKRPLTFIDDTPLHARFHFTLDQTETPLIVDGIGAGALPCTTIEARLLAGPSHDRMELLSSEVLTGHLVRMGTTPSIPFPPCADQGRYTIDDDGITTFAFELPPPSRNIRDDERVHIELIHHNARTSDQDTVAAAVQLTQTPQHLNHVVLPVASPITIPSVRPHFDGLLHIQTNITSPFGDYDVAMDTLGLNIRNSDGRIVAARHSGEIGPPTLRYAVYHDRWETPVQALYSWDLRAANLPDGTYTIHVVAENSQHTARTTASAAFALTDGGRTLILTDHDGYVGDPIPLVDIVQEGLPLPAMFAVFALLSAAWRKARRRP